MANRIVLNETSYFGWGAREVLPEEIKKENLKKLYLLQIRCCYLLELLRK